MIIRSDFLRDLPCLNTVVRMNSQGDRRALTGTHNYIESRILLDIVVIENRSVDIEKRAYFSNQLFLYLRQK